LERFEPIGSPCRKRGNLAFQRLFLAHQFGLPGGKFIPFNYRSEKRIQKPLRRRLSFSISARFLAITCAADSPQTPAKTSRVNTMSHQPQTGIDSKNGVAKSIIEIKVVAGIRYNRTF